jgi:putative transposase
MVYIDLNMVRAGVVDHPGEWPFCGYSEIMSSRQRYRLVDRPKLMDTFQFGDEAVLRTEYNEWIREALTMKAIGREGKWTESVAVGGKEFIDLIKNKLGVRGGSREVEEEGGDFVLREERHSYPSFFGKKNNTLSNIIKPGKNRFVL